MKGLKKVLLVAAVAAPFAAQAELKSIDDAAMADVSGQSGLLIEAGFGGRANVADITNVDFSNAGITIEAFKWEVDLEVYDAAANTHTTTASGATGGFIAQGIKIAGAVDMTIDGVVDAGTGHGGIAIGFEAGSVIDFRVDNMAVFATGQGVAESMGAIEIIGMDISGLDLTISGRGAAHALTP